MLRIKVAPRTSSPRTRRPAAAPLGGFPFHLRDFSSECFIYAPRPVWRVCARPRPDPRSWRADPTSGRRRTGFIALLLFVPLSPLLVQSVALEKVCHPFVAFWAATGVRSRLTLSAGASGCALDEVKPGLSQRDQVVIELIVAGWSPWRAEARLWVLVTFRFLLFHVKYGIYL